MADMDEMLEDEENEIITLVNDDDKEINFYHLATIDLKDEWYIVLQPVEELDDIAEDEVIIYKLGSNEDGSDSILPIESEEELEEVFNEFQRLVESDEECGEECGCGCDGCGSDHCNC